MDARRESRAAGDRNDAVAAGTVRPRLQDFSEGDLGPDNQQIDDAASLDAALLREEARAQVHDAIADLPPRLRCVVNGYYFDHRKGTDLAIDLSVTGTGISKMRARALSRLRNRLEGCASDASD